MAVRGEGQGQVLNLRTCPVPGTKGERIESRKVLVALTSLTTIVLFPPKSTASRPFGPIGLRLGHPASRSSLTLLRDPARVTPRSARASLAKKKK